MNIYIRKFLLIFFVVIFFISAPIVLGYALGYRFDFQNKRVTRIGIIYLESRPKGATIFLNGKKIKEKTPTTIKRLFPKTYWVRIEKEGFHPWEKHLIVLPNQNTLVSGIILFPQDLQSKKLENFQNIKFVVFSPSGKYLAIGFTNNKIALREINDNKNEIIDLNESLNQRRDLVSMTWANYDENILFVALKNKGGTSVLAYKIKEKKWLSFPEYINNFSQINSHPQNANLFYLNKGGEIVLWNINTGSSKILFKNAKKFLVTKSNIFVIQNDNGEKSRLLKTNLLGQNKEIVSQDFPSGDSEFFAYNDNAVIINEKTAYLVKEKSLQKILDNINGIVWSNDANKFLLYNDHELWIYFLDRNPYDNQNPELILSSTTEIKYPHWQKDNNYIFVLHQDVLKSLELDGRNHRNIYDLISLNQNQYDYFLTKDNEILHFKKEQEEIALYITRNYIEKDLF